MKRCLQILTHCFVLLLPFQDSGLQATGLRFLGSSLSVLPLASLLMLYILRWLLSGRWRMSSAVVKAAFYIAAVNVVYLLIGPAVSHGELLVVKAGKLFLINILFVFPIVFLDYRNLNLKKSVVIAFWLAAAGAVCLWTFPGLDGKSFLHFHEKTNMRPRGFSLEASTLSVSVISLGLLAVHFAESRAGKAILSCAMVGILVLSGSKGGIISLGVALFVSTLIARRLTISKRLALVFAGLVVGIGVFGAVATEVQMDISDYTSAATRVTLAGTALVTVVHNPFGVGYAGFLPAIDKYGPEAGSLISRTLNVPFNLAEVTDYFGSETTENVSTKTFLLDNGMFFGIPFLVAFVVVHSRLICSVRDKGEFVLLLGLCFLVIAICTYVDAVGQYNIALFYGVGFGFYRQKSIGCLA